MRHARAQVVWKQIHGAFAMFTTAQAPSAVGNHAIEMAVARAA